MLRCEYFDDGTGYLVADFRIDCHSVRYTQMVIFATVMVFVYPVGIPLWYWWLLYRQRVRLLFELKLDLFYPYRYWCSPCRHVCFCTGCSCWLGWSRRTCTH
jgi:hypothetical protein